MRITKASTAGQKRAHLWKLTTVRQKGSGELVLKGESLCGKVIDSRGIEETEEVTCPKCRELMDSPNPF